MSKKNFIEQAKEEVYANIDGMRKDGKPDKRRGKHINVAVTDETLREVQVLCKLIGMKQQDMVAKALESFLANNRDIIQRAIELQEMLK